MIEFLTPLLSDFVRSTLFRGPRIIPARVHDFLNRLAGDLNGVVASTPFLLRRMVPADRVTMGGTDETTLASIYVAAGTLLDGDAINVAFDGGLVTFDGSAEFTLRIYLGNDTGEGPVVEFVHIPAANEKFVMRAKLMLVAGLPFGPGDGPDTAAGYGHLILGATQPKLNGMVVDSLDLTLPIMVRVTAQCDLDDTSNLQEYGYNIDYQRAVKHAAALE
jgi:hypothetical protein